MLVASDGQRGRVHIRREDNQLARVLLTLEFLMKQDRERVRLFAGRAPGRPHRIGSLTGVWAASGAMTCFRSVSQASGSLKNVVTEISRSSNSACASAALFWTNVR